MQEGHSALRPICGNAPKGFGARRPKPQAAPRCGSACPIHPLAPSNMSSTRRGSLEPRPMLRFPQPLPTLAIPALRDRNRVHRSADASRSWLARSAVETSCSALGQTWTSSKGLGHE